MDRKSPIKVGWIWRKLAEARLIESNGHFFNQLLSEATTFSPAAFTNILNLSVGLLPQVQHTLPPVQLTVVLATQVPMLGVISSMGLSLGVPDGRDDGNDSGDDEDWPDDHGSQDGGEDDCDVEPLGTRSDHGKDNQEGNDPDRDKADDIIAIREGSLHPRATKQL